MSKKIISLILCGILVFCSFSTCFAISTDSAIKATSDLKLNDVKATNPSTTVEPEDSTATRYYLSSSGTVSSSSVSVNTWGNMITDLTYSLVYSVQPIYSRLSTIINNLSTYLNSNSSTGYYYWDWTPTGGVNQGAPESAENIVTAVRNIGMQTTKSLSYIAEYAYQINDYIQNTGFGHVQIDDNTANGFNQSYLWKRYENGTAGSFTSYRMSADGTSSSANWGLTNHSAIETIGYIMTRFDNSLYQLSAGMIKNWQNYNGNLYNPDLTTTSLGTSGNSFWYDFRRFASNTSQHLARLDYVLASDEEIEARQASSANQDAVVDDFISSSGSASATPSDFADVASIGGDMKNALSSNVSPSSAFTSLSSNSDAWGWFSQSTANSLDTTNNTRSVYPTPHIDSYYNELLETLRFK